MESLELDHKWVVQRALGRPLGELQRERPLLAGMKTCQISAYVYLLPLTGDG